MSRIVPLSEGSEETIRRSRRRIIDAGGDEEAVFDPELCWRRDLIEKDLNHVSMDHPKRASWVRYQRIYKLWLEKGAPQKIVPVENGNTLV